MSESTNYFAMLGLDRKFDLEPSLLEKKYFEHQRQFHPDRFVGKADKEKVAALQKSTDLNAAYETLKSPVRRAEHLLNINGIIIDAKGTKPPQELLMEMLELQENLGDAMTMREVNGFEKSVNKQKNQCIDNIQNAFQENKLDEAAQATIKLKYLNRLSDEIKTKKHILDHETA